MNTKVRAIAIYLPQYHPIPENDETWGRGFTEWVNVSQARPLFKGHYQPRIPADLGFYDLRNSYVREEQARLAREAGIEGFMYWQYYFGNGKMLLEKPFEEVLKSGKPDFPFCLGWANHSWQTATWKRDFALKDQKKIIVEQHYQGVDQYRDHFMYNLSAFKDKRYIRVDNKPVFVIWNPGDHSDEIKKMINIWQTLAKENGLDGIHFIGQEVYKMPNSQLFEMGFDAIYENKILESQEKVTHNLWWHVRHKLLWKLNLKSFLDKYDYKKVNPFLVSNECKKKNVYPTLLAGYDRSPRAGRRAIIFYNFTPETWKEHVKKGISSVLNKDYEHRIVMVKSWNEWGESNYLEPDRKYGHQMLDVLSDEIICK